jgi:hypothetical protein
MEIEPTLLIAGAATAAIYAGVVAPEAIAAIRACMAAGPICMTPLAVAIIEAGCAEVCIGMGGGALLAAAARNPTVANKLVEQGKAWISEAGEVFSTNGTKLAQLTAGEAAAIRAGLSAEAQQFNAITAWQKSPGTVWDSMRATQPAAPGSNIPRSFELMLDSGEKFWINPNATKHIVEYEQSLVSSYIKSNGALGTDGAGWVGVSVQAQLNSLKAAIGTAASDGIVLNQMVRVGEWELIFGPPRIPGGFPALYHALIKY